MKTKILIAMLFTALIFVLALGGCKNKNSGSEYHMGSSEYAALESSVVGGNSRTDSGSFDVEGSSSKTTPVKDESKTSTKGDTTSNKTEVPSSSGKQDSGTVSGSSSSNDKVSSTSVSSGKNETSSAASSSKDSNSSAVSSNDVIQGGSGDMQIGNRPEGVPDIWA